MENALTKGDDSSGTAKLIYILYLVSLIIGLTGIIGVVMAYIYRSDAAEWLQAHYRFQIRTFWIGFLVLLIAIVLMWIGVGFIIYALWFIWMIVRCVKGLKALGKSQPPANPGTWLF